MFSSVSGQRDVAGDVGGGVGGGGGGGGYASSTSASAFWLPYCGRADRKSFADLVADFPGRAECLKASSLFLFFVRSSNRRVTGTRRFLFLVVVVVRPFPPVVLTLFSH